MHKYNIREHLFSVRHQNSCVSHSFNSYTYEYIYETVTVRRAVLWRDAV